jgi:hypothetical protein
VKKVIDGATGEKIFTFISGTKKIYSLIVAITIYSLSPLFAGIILHYRYKKDKSILLKDNTNVQSVDAKKAKKEI